jgi:hypothetical protein
MRKSTARAHRHGAIKGSRRQPQTTAVLQWGGALLFFPYHTISDHLLCDMEKKLLIVAKFILLLLNHNLITIASSSFYNVKPNE